jgi:hypothetical protein
VCRFVGTVPDMLGLLWLRFRPKFGPNLKMFGRILKIYPGRFSSAEHCRLSPSEFSVPRLFASWAKGLGWVSGVCVLLAGSCAAVQSFSRSLLGLVRFRRLSPHFDVGRGPWAYVFCMCCVVRSWRHGRDAARCRPLPETQ